MYSDCQPGYERHMNVQQPPNQFPCPKDGNNEYQDTKAGCDHLFFNSAQADPESLSAILIILPTSEFIQQTLTTVDDIVITASSLTTDVVI